MPEGEWKERYRGVNLPRELMEDIDQIVAIKRLGFKSSAEFVRAATRDKVKNYMSILDQEDDVD